MKDKNRLIKMTIRLSIIFCIVAVVMGYISISIFYKIRGYAEYSIYQNSERMVSEIGTLLNYAKYSIDEVANSVSKNMETCDDKAITDEIAAIMPNTPFEGIEYIREDGMNITPSGESFDASKREYYIEGIKGNTGIWVNFEPKYSNEALINFYTPFYFNGEIKGVITGYLGGEKTLNPLLQISFFGDEVRGIICNSKGRIISTTGKLKYGDILAGFDDSNEIFDEIKKSGRIDYFNKYETVGISCIHAIENTDWYVIQIVPRSSLRQVTGQFTFELFLAIVVIMTLFILLVVYLLHDNKKRLDSEKKYNSEIEKMNQRLEKEKLAISKIHEALNSGTWEIHFDDEGKMQCVYSDGLRRMLGFYNENDFPNSFHSWEELVDEETKKTTMENFKSAAGDYQDKVIFYQDNFIARKNGEKKWYRMTGRFTRKPDGAPIDFYGLLMDIDKQKRDEEKLIREQQRLENSLREQLRLEQLISEEKR